MVCEAVKLWDNLFLYRSNRSKIFTGTNWPVNGGGALVDRDGTFSNTHSSALSSYRD